VADINNGQSKEQAKAKGERERERAEITQGQGKGNVRTAGGTDGIYAANMTDIDIDAIGFRALRGIRRRPREQRERKRFCIDCISDGRRIKAKRKEKIVQKEGAHDGTRTHVGMSKRLDLITLEIRKGRHEPPSYALDRGHYWNEQV
jgi:hypothetical protein